jgi:hypothetical protein
MRYVHGSHIRALLQASDFPHLSALFSSRRARKIQVSPMIEHLVMHSGEPVRVLRFPLRHTLSGFILFMFWSTKKYSSACYIRIVRGSAFYE